MQRTTIKDIAELLGVNPSTVSRALRDQPDVSPELRRAIKELAEQLDYHPNFQAINFRKGRSRLIGLIVPEVSMFFWPSVIRAVADFANEQGFSLMLLPSNDSLRREIQSVSICQDNGVEGLLISLSKETLSLDHLEKLQKQQVPVVLFDKVAAHPQFSRVVIDDEQAAMQAADYLIGRGYTRIAGLFGDPNMSISQYRIKGFRKSLMAAGMEPKIVFAASPEEASQAVTRLFSGDSRPDALYLMSDEILSGVMPTLLQLGVAIPRDCAIVAMSDGYMPRILTPGITHIEHSGYAVGNAAVKQLFTLLNQPKTPSQTLTVATRLVELGSA